MHNIYRNQDDVKVAVYEANLSSEEARNRSLQDSVAIALIGISALLLYWVG